MVLVPKVLWWKEKGYSNSRTPIFQADINFYWFLEYLDSLSLQIVTHMQIRISTPVKTKSWANRTWARICKQTGWGRGRVRGSQGQGRTTHTHACLCFLDKLQLPWKRIQEDGATYNVQRATCQCATRAPVWGDKAFSNTHKGAQPERTRRKY